MIFSCGERKPYIRIIIKINMVSFGLGLGLLLSVFLFSKEVIVINEKTLVAFSFVTFMYFVMSKYSNEFAAGLDEKGNTLQEEYDRSKTLEKEYVQKLISFHETQSHIASEMSAFASSFDASFNELLATREAAYTQMLHDAIELKLSRLHEVEKRSLSIFQELLVDGMTETLHYIAEEEDSEESDLDQLEMILDSPSEMTDYEVVENPGGYEGPDAVWNAEYDASEDIEYELLGDASSLSADVFADPNSVVELYRENDFLE
jgi:hypothetical protein